MADAHVSANSKYGLLLYNSVPVESQKRVDDEIKITFHNGHVIFVSTQDWLKHKEYVFIPRSLGSREHIVKNWHSYKNQVVQ